MRHVPVQQISGHSAPESLPSDCRTTAARNSASPPLPRGWLIHLVTLITLAGGVSNLYSALNHAGVRRQEVLPERLRELLPLEFLHVPRSFTLLIGFVLVISAVNLWQRKRRAFHLALALSGFSFVFNLLKGHSTEQALLALLLAALLVWLRQDFTVRSSGPDFQQGLAGLLLAAGVAFGYGVAGFWLLDRREFGLNFDWLDALRRTLRFLTFMGDDSLIPHTRYAAWFLDSLYLLSAAVILYALLTLFRPILYRWHRLPHDQARARHIVAEHGHSVLDFFKLWPDKSYFFNAGGTCFVAYRVAAGFALALGDPVGPTTEIAATIAGFRQFCDSNGWGLAFHQVQPDYLFLYRQQGFKKLKLGDEAIVDLLNFSLAGKAMKKFRHRCNQMEGAGIRIRHYVSPIPDELLKQLREVSDEWLSLPGKRERTFTLGQFERRYMRTSSIVTADDRDGRVLAFVNLIPSGRTEEATFDLMRHRADAPNGVMDYLLLKLILHCQEQGFARFNLGLAPMCGFQEYEEATVAERAVHLFMQRLTFLFSFHGLKAFKAKYADAWEPRYIIYRNVLDLPRVGLALGRVSELSHRPGTDADVAESDELVTGWPAGRRASVRLVAEADRQFSTYPATKQTG